jgi:beta-lactamase class A
MRPRYRLIRVAAAVLLGSVLVPFPAPSAGAAVSATAVSSAVCRSSSHSALAARLSGDIRAALRGRVSSVAVGVDDPGLGLVCWLSSSRHFDSASVVKVTILGALLRKALDQHRYLTGTEAARARR